MKQSKQENKQLKGQHKSDSFILEFIPFITRKRNILFIVSCIALAIWFVVNPIKLTHQIDPTPKYEEQLLKKLEKGELLSDEEINILVDAYRDNVLVICLLRHNTILKSTYTLENFIRDYERLKPILKEIVYLQDNLYNLRTFFQSAEKTPLSEYKQKIKNNVNTLVNLSIKDKTSLEYKELKIFLNYLKYYIQDDIHTFPYIVQFNNSKVVLPKDKLFHIYLNHTVDFKKLNYDINKTTITETKFEYTPDNILMDIETILWNISKIRNFDWKSGNREIKVYWKSSNSLYVLRTNPYENNKLQIGTYYKDTITVDQISKTLKTFESNGDIKLFYEE